MKPRKSLPRTVTLADTVYRVRRACGRLFVRSEGRAEEVRYFLDLLDRTITLPADTACGDWPELLIDMHEAAVDTSRGADDGGFNVDPEPLPAGGPTLRPVPGGGWVVDINGQMWPVKLTTDYPKDDKAGMCSCLIDHNTQSIAIVEHLRAPDLLGLLGRAMASMEAKETRRQRKAA